MANNGYRELKKTEQCRLKSLMGNFDVYPTVTKNQAGVLIFRSGIYI
jgi:hypothetical protein